MELNLPRGGGPTRKVDPKDLRLLEINTGGQCMLDNVLMLPDLLERELVNAYRQNPNLVVQFRLDQKGLNEHTLEMIDRCLRNGITQVTFETLPRRTK